jgi:outer membrane cobalamin receptor
MKDINKKILTLGFLLCVSTAAAETEDVGLDKIVVTPSRIEESSSNTARKVDVVTSDEIQKSGAQDLTEVLTSLAAVNISNYGGRGASKTIRMRGSTAAQVLVMVDGVPVNNPRDGETNLSNIPLDNVARIEVMRGPGSSLYGAGAMGGVVNIVTKNPPKEGAKTELYSSFGTARSYIERMSYGARAAKFGMLASAEYQNSEGSRDNSKLDAKNTNLKLEYGPNEANTLKANCGLYESTSGAPGSKTYPDTDDKQNTLKNMLDLSWVFHPDEETGLLLRSYQNYDRLEFIENSTSYDKNIHATTVRGLNLQFNRQTTDIYRLVCGFNYVKNLNDSTSSAKHKYNVRAAYLENHLDLFDGKLGLNAGTRVDDYSNFGSEISPNCSLLYKLNDDIKFRGSVSRSFRAPTFNDLYWPTTNYWWGGGESGNSSLNPEKGITKELGVDVKINRYLASGLTYFHSDYKQLIQWSADESGMWQPENVGSAVMDGLELENKVSISDNLEADINYSFLMAKDKYSHKYLVYQPKHKVDCSIEYKDLKGFSCALNSQFTDKRFYNSANTIKIKRFFVLGLNLSRKFKNGLTCFASIDNLLNRKYEVIRDYPMPGTSFSGGMKLEF